MKMEYTFQNSFFILVFVSSTVMFWIELIWCWKIFPLRLSWALVDIIATRNYELNNFYQISISQMTTNLFSLSRRFYLSPITNKTSRTWIWVTRRMSYKEQELLIICENLAYTPTPYCVGVSVANLFALYDMTFSIRSMFCAMCYLHLWISHLYTPSVFTNTCCLRLWINHYCMPLLVYLTLYMVT